MGEVYRAHDTHLERDVALKILPSELAGDLSRRARFEQEARAVAALNHPNIVAVYDVGYGYMVSELVHGETLRGGQVRTTAIWKFTSDDSKLRVTSVPSSAEKQCCGNNGCNDNFDPSYW
jgi:serine/threonine protein kinase